MSTEMIVMGGRVTGKTLEACKKAYEEGFKKGLALAEWAPKWIPVGERLPLAAGKYLVTVKNGNVYAGTFDAYSGKFHGAVIAWMPLPSPYKAESEEGHT